MIAAFTSEWATALARWLGYLGASVLVGVVALRLQRQATESQLNDSRRLVRLAGLALLVAVLTRMTQQALLFAAAPEEALAMVGILRGTAWGTAWTVQLLAALAATFLPGAYVKKGLLLALALALMAVLPPAFQGHAFGAEEFMVQAVVADALHLLAAGVWMGTLAVLVIVWLGQASGTRALEFVTAFSPWALTGAATLGVTGVFASWLHVRTPAMVWGSSYGRTLLLKVVLVLAVLALGAVNWKRITPALLSPGGVARLRTSARTEVAIAVLVFLVTAFLVATSLPGE